MRFSLTGGQKADVSQAIPLLTGLEAGAVIADKGYESNRLLDFVRASGAEAVIPPKSNRREPWEYDRELYKQRNLIERAFNKLKQWRRIATDTTAEVSTSCRPCIWSPQSSGASNCRIALEGWLVVQYQGQIIPTQEAPPRPGMLRAAGVGPLEGSRTSHGINGTGGQWDACLERLETGEVDRDMRPRKSKAQQHRIPGARQKALWENVQQARLKGLSIRGIARELGIPPEHRPQVCSG